MTGTTSVRERIAALSAEHPEYTNRQISRILNCSPQYVGRVRPGGSPRDQGQSTPNRIFKVNNISPEYQKWIRTEAKKLGCKPSDLVGAYANDAIAEAMEAGQ